MDGSFEMFDLSIKFQTRQIMVSSKVSMLSLNTPEVSREEVQTVH